MSTNVQTANITKIDNAEYLNRLTWLTLLSLANTYLDTIESQYATPDEKEAAKEHLGKLRVSMARYEPQAAPEEKYKNAFRAWARLHMEATTE